MLGRVARATRGDILELAMDKHMVGSHPEWWRDQALRSLATCAATRKVPTPAAKVAR